ncbi:hypothetical protein VI817_001499 [Penicillium citrinum]|nr:hypothetical protein VI817_001499 [Penicillium citrinum]
MRREFRGDLIYQAETDVHFPQLTVGQTLLYAALARTPANRPPGVSREQCAVQLRNVVMAVFGISHTVDTKVGNEFVRGVSGGERKTVSIAEVALSSGSIQCWDSSTRGLDSTTALKFVQTLKLPVGLTGTAAVVALYQASQQAYEIYFGPIECARKYFTDLGYICPGRQTTADFLTSLTTPAERIVQPGFENRVPQTSEEFAKSEFHVHCSELEVTLIQPPDGTSCGEYMAPYLQLAGGEVYNPTDMAGCQYCQFSNSDMYLAAVSVYYDERWRNFGLVWAYVAFNIFGALFFY